MFNRRKKKAQDKSGQTLPPASKLKNSLLSLEQRLMFDAAAAATASEVASEQVAQEQAEAAVSSGATDGGQTTDQRESQELLQAIATYTPGESTTEIAFVDPTVPDYQQMIAGMGPNVEVVVLDGTRDGMEQIAESLAGRSGVDAIHLISHGSAGELQLGTGTLTAESMSSEYADEFATIRGTLSDQADILVYGCNFGEGAEGGDAVNLLAELTGADVAASSDQTGHINLGGDWEFEVQAGSIETDLALTDTAQMNWAGILGTETVKDTFSSTSYSNNNGTQSWSTSWSETDASGGGASGGDVRVNSSQLRIDTDTVGNAISRGVNLSSATSATLTFAYTNSLTGADRIEVRVSTDGGANYQTLSNGIFSNAANTGSGTASLDLSSYLSANTRIQFIVTATGGGERLYVDNVQVSYQTNNAPAITSNGGGATASISVAENTTTVTTVAATDADTSQTLTYSISGGADAAKFAINSSTGALSFASAPNYESPTDSGSNNVYDVTVQVSDGQGGTDTQAIAVTVANANEAPTDLVQSAGIGIDLNADGGNNSYLYTTDGGAILGGRTAFSIEAQFSATSAPVSGEHRALLSYATAGSDNEVRVGIAQTSASTCQLTLTIHNSRVDLSGYDASGLFDGEQHQLGVTWSATNGGYDFYVDGQLVGSGTGLQTGYTTESTGTLVVGMDQDSVGGGFQADQAFEGTLQDVRVFNDVRTAAEISAYLYQDVSSSESGLVADWTMNDLSGGSTSDTVAGRNLTVGSVSGAGWVTSTPSLAWRVVENASNGTVVGTVTGTDPDSGDTKTYSLTDTAGGRFAIDSATGELTVADSSLLDYEAATSHSVTVRVTDSGGLTYDETFTINLTNVTESLIASDDAAANNEDSVISGNVLLNDTAGDGGSLTASLVSGPSHGSLTLNADGSYSYTPDPNWNGTDSFQYLVNDGSGLAHYWGLEGNGTDTVGGANGTLMNDPTTIAGQDGTALQFDGVDDYVVLPNLTYTNEFSLSFSFQVADNSGTGIQYFYSHGAVGVQNAIHVSLAEESYSNSSVRNNLVTTVWDSNDPASGQVNVDISGLIGDGQWHTYTMSVTDAGGTEVYVDGVLRGSIARGGDAINPTGNAYLGARSDLDPTRSLNAGSCLDSVALFNRALTSAEVTSLAANPMQATVTLTVNPVNDVPVLTPQAPDVTFVEGGMAQVIDATGTITDVDSANFDGGVLTVSISANGTVDDRLMVGNWGTGPGQVGVSGSTVTYEGTVIGTVSGGTSGSDSLTVTFNTSATSAAVQEVYRSIQFNNVSDDPSTATRTLAIGLTDGDGGTATPQTKLVYVQGSNDAPTDLALSDNTVAENAANGSVVGTVSGTDPDSSDTKTYSLTDTAGGRFAINSSTGALTVADGTLLDYESAASHSVTVRVTDSSGLTYDETFTINLTNVNETPTGADATVTINEDTAHTLTAANFSFSDVDAGDSLSAVRIDSLPSAGTLTLSGVAVTAGQVVSLANITAGNLVFTPAANATGSGYASLTFSVRDGSSAYDTTPNTLTVDVTAVNDAPTDLALSANTVAENAANGTVVGTVTGTDPDSGDTKTYSFTDTAGGRFAINSSTGQITVADSSLLNYESATSHSVTVRVTDSGGLTYDETFTINLTNINEAPTGADATVTLTEDTAQALTPANFGFGDVDAGDSLSAVRIDTLPGAGTLTLSGAAVTAGQVVSVADLTAGNLVFTPAANATGTGYANLTFSVRDSNNAYDAAPNTLTIDVTAVNDEPVVTVDPSDVNFTEQSPVGIDVNLTISDIDSGTMTGATVRISANYESGVDELAFTDQNGISGTWNSTTGTLTLSGTASVADYQTALRSIAFYNGSDTPSTLTRTIEWIVTDGTDPSAAAYRNITVSGVNDAPVNTVPGAQTVNEDTSFPVSGVSVTDVDGNLSTVQLGVLNGTVSVTLQGAATISAGSNGTNTLTLSGSQADINATLATLVYQGTSNYSGSDTLTVTSTDSNAVTDVDTVAITVNAVNDPTVVTAVGPTVTFVEGGSPQVIGPLMTVTDVDSTNFDTGVLTISLTQNGTADDRLLVGNFGTGLGQVGTSGSNVSYEGVVIGTFTGGTSDSDPLVITFNANATVAAVQEVVTSIQFQNVSESPSTATRQVTFELTDGDGGTATPATKLVNVQATNDAPTDLALSANTVIENAVTGTVVGTVSGTDSDSGDTKTYSLTDTAGGRFAIDSATGALTVADSSLLNYESAMSHSVTVRVTDAGGLSYDETFTINLTNVNEAPTGVDATVTINEDTPHTFTTTNFGFSDVDAGDSLSAVRIDSLPSAGTLTLSGVAVTAGQVVSVANITAGNLVFTPAANATGSGYANLTFSVRDSNNAYDTTPNTLTINVTAVNDAPILNTNEGASVDEGASIILSAKNLEVVDIDNGTSQVLYTITSLPINGTILIKGTPLSVKDTFTQDDIDSGIIEYQHDGSETDSDSFAFVVNDGAGGSLEESTFKIAVTPVNDAPTDLSLSSNTVAENAANGTVVGIVSGTDPDSGDTKTYSLADTAGGRFAINSSTGQITVANGSLLNYESATNHTVTVRVTDSGGLTYDETFTINLTNVNETPTGADATVTINEDTAHTLSTANFGFSDVDAGDSLSAVRIDTLPAAGTLTLSGVAVTAGQVITVVDITAGNLVFTPAADATGTGYANVTFSVRDSGNVYDAAPNTLTIDVTAVNDAPVNAVPGAQSVAEDTPLALSGISVNDVDGNLSTVQLGVLNGTLNVTLSGGATISAGNNGTITLTLSGTQADINATLATLVYQGTVNYTGADTLTVTSTDMNSGTDVDTVALTVTAVNDATMVTGGTSGSGNEDTTITGTLTATDVEGLSDGTVFTVTGAATQGTASIDPATGLWSYTPTADWNGTDSFTVTITDDAGNSTTQVISVTVTPVVDLTTDSLTTNEDAAISANVLTGTNGATADSFEGTPVLTGVTQGANGSVTFLADGTVTYTPNANFNGTDSFTYTITSGGVTETATVTVTVNAVNDATVVTGGTSGSGTEDTTITGTLTATDAEGLSDGTVFSVTGAATQGTASIDPATGLWSYTPTADWNGTDSFTVTITDDTGNSTTQVITVMVTAVNDAPVLTANTGSTVAEGDTDTIVASELAVTDVDTTDAQLTYTIGTGPIHGQLELISAPGVSTTTFTQADIAGNRVVYVHDGSETTSDSFTFTVSDGTGGALGATTVTLTITPVNDAPTITSNGGGSAASINVAENVSAVTIVTGADVDLPSQVLTYSLNGGADQALFTIDASTGALNFAAPPDFEVATDANGDHVYVVQVQVIDSQGASTTQMIQVTVTDVAETVVAPSNVLTIPPVLLSPSLRESEKRSQPVVIERNELPANLSTTATEQPSKPAETAVHRSGEMMPSATPIESPIFIKQEDIRRYDTAKLEPVMPRWDDSSAASPFTIMPVEPEQPIDSKLPEDQPSISDVLLAKLDAMAKSLEEEVGVEQEHEMMVARVAALGGTTLSVGFVAWAVRSSAILASCLTTLPVWKSFDPLAVTKLSRQERDRRRQATDAAQRQEQDEFGGLEKFF